MVRAVIALGASAVVIAAIDLTHKAAAGGAHLHERSGSYVVVVMLLAAAWAAAIVAARSLSLALGGGVVAGGAIGNLASLAIWPGVPNPIVVEPIAFNLADVFVLAGFLLVTGTVLALVVQAPERPRESVGLR